MKNLILKILGLIVVLVVVLAFYINSSSFIENQDWKYAEGTHLGDQLGKNKFRINNRIITSDIGEAKIIFCYGRELVIENLQTKERGFYINKSGLN